MLYGRRPFLHSYIRNRTIRVGKFVHFFRAGWVTSIRGTLFGLMNESWWLMKLLVMNPITRKKKVTLKVPAI